MKNKTEQTIRRFETVKYRLILEGICVGVLTGMLVSLFRLALEKAEGFRNHILAAVDSGQIAVFSAVIMLICAGTVVYFTYKIVPLCSGSGIPQVKGELKGQVEQNWYAIILAKFVGGVCAIGGGLSLGREGPSIQLGAMVGKGFSRLAKKLRTEEKLLMTCGAGAGLSAAFGAPLAGVVFTLEELHKNFSTEVLISTMGAAAASDFVSSYIFGLEPVFDLNVGNSLPLSRYWMIVVLGLALGIFGVFYNFVINLTQNMYDKVRWKGLKTTIAFACALALAAIYPKVLGSGHWLVGEIAGGNFVLQALALLLVVKFVFSAISFGCGAPGGIFLPLLVLGAILGGVFAESIGPLFGYENLYIANFVILGMTGLFSSIVRAPITGVILITEMTGDFNNFLSLAIVALISYIVAEFLKGKPIYDQLLYRMLSQDSDHGTNDETRRHKVLLQSDVYYGSLMDGEKVEKMLLPKGCLIVSVQRDNKEIVPDGETVLKGGDKLVILCNQEFVHMVSEKLKNICESI